MNRRTPLPPLLRGLNPDMQLLIDDPVAKRHAAALIAFERNRSVSFDEYMSAVSFFFQVDIQRGVECPMYDVLRFTLRDLYDQEPLPSCVRLVAGAYSMDSSIPATST